MSDDVMFILGVNWILNNNNNYNSKYGERKWNNKKRNDIYIHSNSRKNINIVKIYVVYIYFFLIYFIYLHLLILFTLRYTYIRLIILTLHYITLQHRTLTNTLPYFINRQTHTHTNIDYIIRETNIEFSKREREKNKLKTH